MRSLVGDPSLMHLRALGVFALAALCARSPAAAQVQFQRTTIDDNAGDVKLAGDIDGDGFPDLVLGGNSAEKLNWYRNPDWMRTIIATPIEEFTTDGRLGDIDGDGDLDIVVPDGSAGQNLKVFLNPLHAAGGPDGDPTNGPAWILRGIGTIGDYGKDVYLADFDADGRLDIATRSATQAMIFFQTGPDTWSRQPFSSLPLGNEGMSMADIDRDGSPDLIVRGAWVRNPGGAAARTTANWTVHTITSAPIDFRALAADLNADGRTDVLFSSSEGTADVTWSTPTTADYTGPWATHVIVPTLNRAHTLQAADIDLDGRVDVVLGQMHTSIAKELAVYRNLTGNALSWDKRVIDNTGIHLGVLVDIDRDGDTDIFGANWTTNPPARLWINERLCGLPSVAPPSGLLTPLVGHPLSLSATLFGAGPAQCRWNRNGQLLADGPAPGGGMISGAATRSLTIAPAGRADSGLYTLVASALCGDMISDQLDVRVHCPADVNADLSIDPADVAIFISIWYNSVAIHDTSGDYDHSGQVDPADVAVFVIAWFSATSDGC